jgi:hypothetical protein
MPGNALTPSERTQRARLAANIGWAFTQDRSARTEPARRAAFARFEKLVDPDRVLPVAERAKRAESLRKAHLQRMALRSAKARRTRGQARKNSDHPQERTRVMEDALATTLTTIIETVPLSDEQRERITELMGGGDGDEG